MTLKADNKRFVRAPYLGMLNRSNLDALGDIPIAQATKLRAK